jgi:hypothetical protein
MFTKHGGTICPPLSPLLCPPYNTSFVLLGAKKPPRGVAEGVEAASVGADALFCQLLDQPSENGRQNHCDNREGLVLG